MLQDLIMELVCAVDNDDKELAYKKLEKIGVDRITANDIVKEFGKEKFDDAE